MCGRTGLNLNRDNLRCACAFKPRNTDTFEKPDWVEEPNYGKSYTPSNNIAPTDVTPVLLSKSGHSGRILKPMMWGMVPPWHKGEYNKHGLSTNNCRIENILTSKLYGPALHGGFRCIVLAEGFYEWQTTNKNAKTKQPYYIYSPQENGAAIDDPTSWNNEFDEGRGWKGIKLLKMAGLYNTWNGPLGTLYSYSIITLESNSTLDWLHHRMPAILDNDEIIEKWLDPTLSGKECVSLLKPVTHLAWHPVSTLVNNSRNKSEQCNKRISLDLDHKPQSAVNKMMRSWLTKVPNQLTTDRSKTKPVKKNVLEDWLKGGKRRSDGPDSEEKRRKQT